jgi:hypothetical protein
VHAADSSVQRPALVESRCICILQLGNHVNIGRVLNVELFVMIMDVMREALLVREDSIQIRKRPQNQDNAEIHILSAVMLC